MIDNARGFVPCQVPAISVWLHAGLRRTGHRGGGVLSQHWARKRLRAAAPREPHRAAEQSILKMKVSTGANVNKRGCTFTVRMCLERQHAHAGKQPCARRGSADPTPQHGTNWYSPSAIGPVHTNLPDVKPRAVRAVAARSSAGKAVTACRADGCGGVGGPRRARVPRRAVAAAGGVGQRGGTPPPSWPALKATRAARWTARPIDLE